MHVCRSLPTGSSNDPGSSGFTPSLCKAPPYCAALSDVEVNTEQAYNLCFRSARRVGLVQDELEVVGLLAKVCLSPRPNWLLDRHWCSWAGFRIFPSPTSRRKARRVQWVRACRASTPSAHLAVPPTAFCLKPPRPGHFECLSAQHESRPAELKQASTASTASSDKAPPRADA